MDERGVAERGLLVRHLVMPNNTAGTGDWMRFLASLSTNTYVNVMDQYRPVGNARKHPEISRPPSPEECEEARCKAREAGITRLDDRAERQVWHLLQRLGR